jgi:hypothetical protein
MSNRILMNGVLRKQSRIARLEWHLQRRDFLSCSARRRVERQIELLKIEIR